ncbi:MAG: bifunctional proline dehydrogenase/L-glutamate gamma-semialdehyde dehydrogenase PutA, partial [Flavobacteriaceae bacterium]
QFATHHAHTVAAILELAEDGAAFEFPRLHGMGEVLHRRLHEQEGTRCRIYAPVGAHRDLLAYLVRRLIENGANSSFVHQIVDSGVPPEAIAADPYALLEGAAVLLPPHIRRPPDLFAPDRANSRGFDLHHLGDLATIEAARAPFARAQWRAEPLMAAPFEGSPAKPVLNPANTDDIVGEVIEANAADAEAALSAATDWRECPCAERAAILNRAADLYEANFGAFFAVLAREAGKTPADAVAELREAVDFLRYYAARIAELEGRRARGLFACISPWNFPLAIFTGQIAAALAAGNGVLAKPADPTPLVAHIAVKLMHEAGVPKTVLQFLPGRGSVVGARLAAAPRIAGISFTGSTATAQTINRAMAGSAPPDAPLIAETGGLNAMIVDSTALPEQAVRDIVNSAFRSAGQRCSALRILFVQEDIAPGILDMLFGAMDELRLGNPWDFTTDVGPVINDGARREILAHIEAARSAGRLLKQIGAPENGTFIGPAAIRVGGMTDMKREIFGPVLHVATFKSSQIDGIVADINASGYGLTFGLHTRIDDRVEAITSALNVGNIYVNRNQIGAIVGSQPFGGEGLSGTGPKAGGPNYVRRFTRGAALPAHPVAAHRSVAAEDVRRALAAFGPPARAPLGTSSLPGPTGESNTLSLYPRGTVLCLGPTRADAEEQAAIAGETGCTALIVCPDAPGDGSLDGFLDREDLSRLTGFEAVALWSDEDDLRAARKALAARDGPLIPLIADREMAERCVIERHVCVDTTAAGGNASLLAGAGTS